MSIIVWILSIQLSGARCLEYPKITFKTEQECLVALHGLDKQHRKIASCKPEKATS